MTPPDIIDAGTHPCTVSRMRRRLIPALGITLSLALVACSSTEPTATTLQPSTTTSDPARVPVPKTSELGKALPTVALLKQEMLSDVENLTAQKDTLFDSTTDLTPYPWAGKIDGGIARGFTFEIPDEEQPHRARMLITVFVYGSQQEANAAVAAARNQYRPVSKDGGLKFGQLSFVYGFEDQSELPSVTGAVISHGLVAAEVLFQDSLYGYDWRKGAARVLEMTVALLMRTHPGLEG